MQWQVFWQVSKNGNSALQPCHFGKYLLTVGGDEQQETAISPSILNTFVAFFLECIPYMYEHSSMMLECKQCDYILSECKMSCSLLTTVMSNKWQLPIDTHIIYYQKRQWSVQWTYIYKHQHLLPEMALSGCGKMDLPKKVSI